MLVNDHVFGLAWSGDFDEGRLLSLIPRLPDGISEIYLHPATEGILVLDAAMPGFRRTGELGALLSPVVQTRVAEFGITLATYSGLLMTRRNEAREPLTPC